MTWWRVSDDLAMHPKALAAGNTALGLWVRAGSWSSQQLTEGWIPQSILRALGGRPRDAAALVAAGMFDEEEGGWWIHGFLDCNPSREQVEATRAGAASRQRRAREVSSSRRDSGVSHGEVRATSRSPRPGPSYPPSGGDPDLRRCPAHPGPGPAPACLACRDVRLAAEHSHAASGAAPSVRSPFCPEHPSHPATRCPSCASAAVPAPTDLRERMRRTG